MSWLEGEDLADDDVQRAYARVSPMYTNYGTIQKEDSLRKSQLELDESTPSKSRNRLIVNKARKQLAKRICKWLSLIFFVPFLLYALLRISNIESNWVFRSSASGTDVYPKGGRGGHSGPIRVTLVGDELIAWPFATYGMAEYIQDLLPGMPLSFVSVAKMSTATDASGGGGGGEATIDKWTGEVRSHILEKEKEKEPAHAVFVFAQADVIRGPHHFPATAAATASESGNRDDYDAGDVAMYTQRMHQLLGFLAAHAENVALAGPGVVTEGALFVPQALRGLAPRVQAFREANAAIAKKYANCEYIDIQRALQQRVPWWYPFGTGFVTVDGRRPNLRGMLIEAEIIAQTLRKWYWPHAREDVWTAVDKLEGEEEENWDAVEDALINRDIIKKKFRDVGMAPLGGGMGDYEELEYDDDDASGRGAAANATTAATATAATAATAKTTTASPPASGASGTASPAAGKSEGEGTGKTDSRLAVNGTVAINSTMIGAGIKVAAVNGTGTGTGNVTAAKGAAVDGHSRKRMRIRRGRGRR